MTKCDQIYNEKTGDWDNDAVNALFLQWSIAREAYARLDFKNVRAQPEEDRIVAAGEAVETPTANQTNYRAWATDVVRLELHKAGWRLADLLQKLL